MTSSSLDLASMFKAVTDVLGQNKDTLNQADDYNHNHGDNMVDIFRAITEAVGEKQADAPANQLAYASQLVRQKSSSGSANVYAEGLASAAQQFMGKDLDQNNALSLITSLMGSSQQPGATAGSQDPQSGMLGSLLGGLTGAETSETNKSGIDAGDILQAGMAFLQARQRGDAPVDALVNAVMANSRMSNSNHRTQSGKMVTNTLLQMLGSLGSK